MKLTPPTEDELNEYVDGRLSEQRRDEIAAWLLDNPSKAREVKRLRQLNAALRDVGSEVLNEEVPDRLREVLRRQQPQEVDQPDPTRRSLSGLVGIAAAATILSLGAAAGWGAHAVFDQSVAQARQAYVERGEVAAGVREGSEPAASRQRR